MAIILSEEAREEIVAWLVEKGNPFYNTRDGEYHTDGELVWWRDAQGWDHHFDWAQYKPPGDRVGALEEADTAEEQAALLRAEIYDEIGDF
jgi:hypothetical protein